jgi:hypothetical protein
MKRKKKSDIKLTYTYAKPKTDAEKRDAEHRLGQAYDILFEHTINSPAWKEKAAKRTKSLS